MSFYQEQWNTSTITKKRKITNQINQRKISLQTYQKSNNHNQKTIVYGNDKRMSSFVSFQKASMTVEAAIAVPIFLFVVVNLLYSLDIIRLYSNVEMAMHQTGRQMAMYAYAYDQIIDQDTGILSMVGDMAFHEVYLKNKILKEVDPEYLEHSPMVNGKRGISFSKTSYMEEDLIDLVAEYKVQSAISVMGFSKISLMNRCRMRAWTGYDNTRKSDGTPGDDSYVYITQTGTVYHTNGNCTHLDLEIEATNTEEVASLRNASGGKYKPCELCGNDNEHDTVFITEQGDRYHKSMVCSGLKRTIYIILLSETGGRRLCERCGKAAE